MACSGRARSGRCARRASTRAACRRASTWERRSGQSFHTGAVPRYVDLAAWSLRVFGEVEEEIELDWEEFRALPRSANVQDIHSVTRWTRFDVPFAGVPWREPARRCRPLPSARFAIAWAEHDYSANVPLSRRSSRRRRSSRPEADGDPLTPDHGYPLRLVVIPGKLLLEEREVAAGHRA